MVNKRAPPGKTPVDDPTGQLNKHWSDLYKKYRQSYGLSHSASLERIAKDHSVARNTVAYHLFPDFRRRHLERKKGKSRFRNSPEYRVRDAARMHVNNNILHYLQNAFEKADYHPLSIDDIRVRIRDIIFESKGVEYLPRGQSLLRRIEQYEKSTGKKLIEKISDEPLYKLF